MKRQLAMLMGLSLGLVSALPWPWGLKKALARSIKAVRDLGVGRFRKTVFSYVEGSNEEYKMGKTKGVNESIDRLKAIIDDLEARNLRPERLRPIARLFDGRNLQEMDDKALNAFVEEVIVEAERMKNGI
jgi:hypothetical protein